MQSDRLRGEKPRPRFLIAIRPLPTIITLGNLLCGFASICWTLLAPKTGDDLANNVCLYWSGMLILFAMVFDMLDGRVARWTKSTSKFGLEMDSLADVVSFGLAPAVLVKAALDNYEPAIICPVPDRYVWLMLSVYVACTALRLARYNVEADTGHRNFFFGLPSPGAAGCVASLVVLISQTTPKPSMGPLKVVQDPLTLWLGALHETEVAKYVLIGLPFLMLFLGILMVSRVHFAHVGDRLLGGKRSLMHFLAVVLGLVLVIMQHELMLVLAFNGYMLCALLNELRYQLFPSQRPAGWVASGEELAELAAEQKHTPPGAAPAQGPLPTGHGPVAGHPPDQ